MTDKDPDKMSERELREEVRFWRNVNRQVSERLQAAVDCSADPNATWHVPVERLSEGKG